MAEIYYFSKVLLNGGWRLIGGWGEGGGLARVVGAVEISLVEFD